MKGVRTGPGIKDNHQPDEATWMSGEMFQEEKKIRGHDSTSRQVPQDYEIAF